MKIDNISTNPSNHKGTKTLFKVNSEMNVMLSKSLFEFEQSLDKLKIAACNYLEDEYSEPSLNGSKVSNRNNSKAYQKFSEQFDVEYNLADLMYGPSSHFNTGKIEEPIKETELVPKYDKKNFFKRKTIAEPLRNQVLNGAGPTDIRNYEITKKIKPDYLEMAQKNEVFKQKAEELLDNQMDFEKRPSSPLNNNMMYDFLDADAKNSTLSSCSDDSRSDMNYTLGGAPNLNSNYGGEFKKIITEDDQDLWNDGNWLSKADDFESMHGLDPQVGVDFNQPFSSFNMNMGCDIKLAPARR